MTEQKPDEYLGKEALAAKLDDAGVDYESALEWIKSVIAVEVAAEKKALADEIRTVLGDCYVSRNEVMPCRLYIEGKFDNGATWTKEMCCLPCKIRLILDGEDDERRPLPHLWRSLQPDGDLPTGL